MSRANRASAMTLGLVVMIITAIMLYVLLPIWPHSSREVIHLIVSVGLVTALVRFGLLERRALG